MYGLYKGAHGLKKRIERTTNRLLLRFEHRGSQFINSVKNEPKNFFFIYIYIIFPLAKVNSKAKKWVKSGKNP